MQIKKDTVDGKEIDVEINNSSQLSDTDLDQVQGGILVPGTSDNTYVYQFVCTICGWRSSWCTDPKRDAKELTAQHTEATFHNDFRCVELDLP
jgi:hypothetical protein